MVDSIRIQIRWPRPLVAELQRIAAQHHTTFSEVVRQAAIREYSLVSDDENSAKNDMNTAKAESLS